MPFRRDGSTIWMSPAGQVVEVEHWRTPPPELERDTELPDPHQLHEVDAELVRVPTMDDDPPF
jgi:hypothetical protein